MLMPPKLDWKTIRAAYPRRRWWQRRKRPGPQEAIIKFDYDDYGEYYHKCLWALQKIGTPEAVSVIEACRAAEDPVLRKEVEYRLGRIGLSNG